MKKIPWALLALCFSQNASAASCSKLSDASLLLGSWQSNSEKLVIAEHWHRLDKQHFVGSSTTKSLTNPNKPPFIESLRLIEMSGAVLYLAKPPQNEMPTPFKLTQCDNNRLRFENPQHDFPKVIEYVRHGKKGLTANVTDGSGKGFKIEFEQRQDKN